MKAIVAHEFGPPESLKLEEWTARDPGPQEIRARVCSAGVSFADLLMAAGQHQFKPELPFIPGIEISGQVLEVGKEVTHLRPGDFVFGGAMGGMLVQEVTLPAEAVQKLREGSDLDAAAVLRWSYVTAWYSLLHCGNLVSGETVLILGAAGAVGIASIQVAKHFGATVIASASTPEKRALALSKGADFVVDARAVDWRDQIRKITGASGVDIVVDPVGGDASEPAFRTLGYRGRHLVVGFASGTIPRIPLNLPLLKGASVVGVLASYLDQREPEKLKAVCEEILDLFYAGVFLPAVGRVYTLADYAEALNAVQTGKIVGRVVLRMA